jgi:protein-disulfide isomerase
MASRWRNALDVAAAVSMIVASTVLVWAVIALPRTESVDEVSSVRPSGTPRSAGKTIPETPVEIGRSASLGSTAAPIALIAYSDYECPFCAKFHRETLLDIQRKYIEPGKVLLVMRHLPLRRHRMAYRAAEIAECSARAGKFWEMHHQLFAAPMLIDEVILSAKVEQVGAKTTDFDRCIDNNEARAVIDEHMSSARDLGISSTPSFLIGSLRPDRTVKVIRHESGAIPVSVFAKMLDDALQRVDVASQ